MPKVTLEEILSKEELRDYEERKDLGAFEKYCGSCDHFDKENECPFYGKVCEYTLWEHQTHTIGGTTKKCDNFWD